MNLRHVIEDTPTGTAGSLALVPNLDKTFLVMNGDLLTDLDFNALVAFHLEQGATWRIATHTRHIKIDLGVLEFDRDHRITGYHEKPEKTYDVSMGIYVYEPHVMKYIEPGKYLDFPDLVVRLIAQGERVSRLPGRLLMAGYRSPEDYAKAQEIVAECGGNADVL